MPCPSCGDPGHNCSSWALTGVRTVLPEGLALRSGETVVTWHLLQGRLQVWTYVLCPAWGMQILLRVSDVGEQVENWEMFIFSIPMAYKRFSQKIQDKEKRWQSNTHFSGVHQPQSVKAFHVVCFNREQFASFCCLLLSWPWVWWPASERVMDEFLPQSLA